MKFSVRLTACLLCLCALLCCVSCAKKDGDTPDGMKNATAAGADFRFYIPAYWNVSTEYGVSGGYYTQAQQCRASVVKYTLTAEQITAKTEATANGKSAITWFWESECVPVLNSYAQGGKVEHLANEDTDILLGELNAKKYHCKSIYNGTFDAVHTVMAIGDAGDAFYVLTCTMEDGLYTRYVADIDKMIQYFKLAEPYVPDDFAKATAKDETAPEGMKLVSNDEVAYRFYAPVSWAVNRNEAIFAAYLESDGSNVSVTPYQPVSGQMSVAQYFDLCEEQMMSVGGKESYTLLSSSETTLGGRKATVYEYTYTVGGEVFRYRQVIAAYAGMIYSLTYTARPENFEGHLADVDMMITQFAFR